MRLGDYLALAGHGAHRGLEAASVLFTAAAVTALCFSGALLAAVRAEKAEPCELTVTAPGYPALTEQSVQDFRAIDRVVDAAGTVEVPVTAESGKYTAGLTLVGIDGDYLDDLVYLMGEPFPTSGAMPWIVLSEAAAQSFTDPEDKTRHGAGYMPDIDWLEADFFLELGGGTVSAKVSGLFEGDGPAAYVGRDIAKALLQSQGQAAGYTGARVRVTDIGAAEAVSRAITDLGYQVENRDSARQEKWDARTREAAYLALLAAAGLLCAGMARMTGAAVGRRESRRRDDVLRWAGMGEAAIRGLGALHSVYLALAGAALGIAAHFFIAALAALGDPSSVFALRLPPRWLSVPPLLCAAAALAFSGRSSRNGATGYSP